jgi:PAS domain S-box-containing protein
VTIARGTTDGALAPESSVGRRVAIELDCTAVLLVRLDLDGRLLEANDAWRQFARASGGMWPGDGVGRSYAELASELGERLAQATARVLQSLDRDPGGQASDELRCFSQNSLRWYRIDARRLGESTLLMHTDISEQRFAEACLRIQALASEALAQRKPLMSACRELAAAVCESLAWDFAAVWLPNDWQQLVCAELISEPALAHGELASLTRTSSFASGQGLPGRVWERCRPLWLVDIGTDGFSPRLARAHALGLRSAFALPMQHDGQVFAVLEFMSRFERLEEPRVLELLGTIGRQLGAEEQRARALVLAEADGVTRSKLEELIENAPGYIVAIDEQRRIHFVNRVLPHVRRDEVVGSDWLRFVPPADHAALLVKLDAVMKQGVPQRYDIGILGPDGREVWLSVHMAPLRERGAITGAIITALDTTELKRAVIEFAAAQRWISVGTLAAGVAHEINTPVQFVGDNFQFIADATRRLLNLTGKFESLLARIAAGTDQGLREAGAQAQGALAAARLVFLREELPRALGACTDGLERVSGIVRSLVGFARPTGAENVAPTDLNALVQSALALARGEYAAVAELSTEWGELPLVRCNAADISQVVLNIVLNAIDAIRDVTGETQRKGMLTVRTWHENEQAVIAIQDSGSGIPEAIRARVFDPFFTTKGVGKGTGQGLALAWSVVKLNHGGAIAFESSVGKGTTFFIRLPIAGNPAPAK